MKIDVVVPHPLKLGFLVGQGFWLLHNILIIGRVEQPARIRMRCGIQVYDTDSQRSILCVYLLQPRILLVPSHSCGVA